MDCGSEIFQARDCAGHPERTLQAGGQAAAVQHGATALPRTVASKHYHQRMIQLRQRSRSLAEYAKGRLVWAAACQASTASV